MDDASGPPSGPARRNSSIQQLAQLGVRSHTPAPQVPGSVPPPSSSVVPPASREVTIAEQEVVTVAPQSQRPTLEDPVQPASSVERAAQPAPTPATALLASVGGSGPNPAIPPAPSSEADATQGLPRRFGKYTLLRKLASGGMAELFLALQKSVAGFEKLIVIKRILPDMNQDRAFIEMLLHEARIAATLSHPNVVQIFDVGQAEGTYFIAMEHIHGEDIRSIVRQMKGAGYHEFPHEHAVGIVLGMCAGLAYAHEKRDLEGQPLNIVHRDISPQNVVVTFSGDVKIVDFGIAKSETAEHETQSGRLKGKVPYMSPEQARGENLDHRSDIFATGVLLFELTTGKRLFKGNSEYETLKLICDREYPLPSWVRPGYPPELERIVMKALEKNPDNRFQSAREMQAALEEFVRHERIRVSTIALQHFMQELFAEKLAKQKEALLHGKQLADVIERRYPSEPAMAPDEGRADASRSSQALAMSSSAPGAVRTLTEVKQFSSRRKAIALGATIACLGALAGVGVTTWSPHRSAGTASTTQAAPATLAKGAIEITSNPPGAAVWINGDLRQEVTPAKISDLPLGRDLEIKITKEGFEAERRTISLTNEQPSSQIEVGMKSGSVTLDLVISPPGIKPIVAVDGKRTNGLVVEGLSSGDQHKIVVVAPGYAEQSYAFIGAPQEKKHIELHLHKETRGGSRVSSAAAPSDARPTSAGAAAGTGKLNVAATGGWCNVSVDGVARGVTPIAGLELPAGPHKLVCTPDGKPAINATVQVPANDVARHRFTIGQ